MIAATTAFPCRIVARVTWQDSVTAGQTYIAHRWDNGYLSVEDNTGNYGRYPANMFDLAIIDHQADWDLWRGRLPAWVRAKQTIIEDNKIIVEARKKYRVTSMSLPAGGVHLRLIGCGDRWFPAIGCIYLEPVEDTSHHYVNDPVQGMFG